MIRSSNVSPMVETTSLDCVRSYGSYTCYSTLLGSFARLRDDWHMASLHSYSAMQRITTHLRSSDAGV